MKRIRSIILVICCIKVGHFGVILYMVVWNLQFSVSNIVRATYLEAVQRCQIYIVLKNSIHILQS